MNKIRITPSVIPNLFTAMNMFSGFLSIIYTAKGGTENFHIAALCIVLAAIFDTLDGAMARLTHSSSEIGVELDSLSDVISFGAAPAFLIYSTYFNDFNPIGLGILFASLPMIAGGFRLARFNVQLVGFEKSSFKGLPIPASGMALAAFILAFYEKDFPQQLVVFILPLVLILSYLMVSTIKYDTFPKFSLKAIKEKPLYPFIILVSLISYAFFQDITKVFFFFFVLLISLGILRHIFNFFKMKSSNKKRTQSV
ncbi:MAG: CDP-diacylglycerol--serine O-phosphatidyltransferase [Syntrophothermus sp.]|nr:CDP-diacylglycerol--serine O-phosphatidyltransferase [Ignavibacteriaceae bacterium]